MQQFQGKKVLTITSSLITTLCLTSSLFAESEKEEPTKEKTSKKNSTDPDAYDADLFKKDKRVFFVNAEFLYWAVNEGAVDYAVKMNQSAWSAVVPTFAVGDYQNAHFGWNPGFRVSFGNFNAPHFWDVYTQYTFVPSGRRDESFAPEEPGQFLVGTWAHPDLGGVAGGPGPVSLLSAKSHIHLDYHVADLLFSRRFLPNEHLRLNVFAGLTAAFLYQRWKVTYIDLNDLRSNIKNKWQFEGGGLRVGAKTDWYLDCWDLYVTGQASGAALAGWYQNSAFQTTTLNVPGTDNSIPIRDTKFRDIRQTYHVQFLAGPSWQKRFDAARMEIFAGYEFNIWTNLHQIYRSSFSPPEAAKETFINDSNVSLQGLTLRVNVDF